MVENGLMMDYIKYVDNGVMQDISICPRKTRKPKRNINTVHSTAAEIFFVYFVFFVECIFCAITSLAIKSSCLSLPKRSIYTLGWRL